jgi:hypothetical protein
MSDGGAPILNDGKISDIIKQSRKSTTIHCIQFGTSDIQPTESFMERLALGTGGTYRYVDVKAWRK